MISATSDCMDRCKVWIRSLKKITVDRTEVGKQKLEEAKGLDFVDLRVVLRKFTVAGVCGGLCSHSSEEGLYLRKMKRKGASPVCRRAV